MVRDLRRQEELRDKEQMWNEKFNAELKMTEKKIEIREKPSETPPIEDNSIQRHGRGLGKV